MDLSIFDMFPSIHGSFKKCVYFDAQIVTTLASGSFLDPFAVIPEVFMVSWLLGVTKVF